MADTRTAIVDAAVEILDSYGLADLSMRRVADAVGIQAASIYWHFANKQELLAGVADQILSERQSSVTISEWCFNLRRALLRHRDAADLLAATLPVGLGAKGLLSEAIDLLEDETSLPAPDSAAKAFLSLILGHVGQEQARQQAVQLSVLPKNSITIDDSGFESGVSLLVAGTAKLGV